MGDPITPTPAPVRIPRLLDDKASIDLVGYPLRMVQAEKIVTALQRGTVNTRWRDFADVYLLSRQHPVDGGDLVTALQTVAHHRGATLESLAVALAGYADVRGVQAKWAARRKRQELVDAVPESFADVLRH